MKLRFDKNSLRLRLKKSDIDKLRDNNSIQEEIEFPDGVFTYKLLLSDDSAAITAHMQSHLIEVIVPVPVALVWMNNDETGLYHTITLNNEHALDVIIEKDFPCKNRPGEDQSDTFSELLSLTHVKQY